jgi:hypothetical protein
LVRDLSSLGDLRDSIGETGAEDARTISNPDDGAATDRRLGEFTGTLDREDLGVIRQSAKVASRQGTYESHFFGAGKQHGKV